MPHSSCLASGLPAMQGLACRGANGLFAGSAGGDAPRHGREPAAPDSAATSIQCSNRSSVRHGHWRHSTVGHRGGRGAARRVPGGEGQSVNLSMGRTRTRVPLWSTTTGAPDARSTSCCFRAAMTICSRESRKNFLRTNLEHAGSGRQQAQHGADGHAQAPNACLAAHDSRVKSVPLQHLHDCVPFRARLPRACRLALHHAQAHCRAPAPPGIRH